MRSVVYQGLTQLTTGTGQGPCQMVRDGRLKGVIVEMSGTSGAAAGSIGVNLLLNAQNENPTLVSNPPRETNLGGVALYKTASLAYAERSPFIPLDVPVKVGDILSMSLNALSTPAAQLARYSAVVVEN